MVILNNRVLILLPSGRLGDLFKDQKRVIFPVALIVARPARTSARRTAGITHRLDGEYVVNTCGRFFVEPKVL
jgi:hypothetical protein